MIENRVQLKIPPGLFMQGSDREQEGRWNDGHMVRFVGPEGTPTPMLGSVLYSLGGAITGTITSAHVWTDIGGSQRIFIATSSKFYTVTWNTTAGIALTDITPASGVAGVGGYSIAILNGVLLIIAHLTSKIWYWTGSGVANGVTEFVTRYVNGSSILVTPERYVVALLFNRNVAWSSQDTYISWIPTDTNTAGSLPLATEGHLLQALVVNNQTLIFTDRDLWQLEYVGGDLVYGARQIATACGMMANSHGGAASARGTAFWMGDNGFFEYDGYVRELQCDIHDYIFDDINRTFAYNFFTTHHPDFKEIWWHYVTTSGAGSTPDRVAVFNYENRTWTKGTLRRSAGTNGVLAGGPGFVNDVMGSLMFRNTSAYVQHARSTTADAGDITAPTPYLQSQPAPLGDGNKVFKIQKCALDGQQPTDPVALLTTMERGESFAVNNIATGGGEAPQDCRIIARYVGYSHEFSTPASRVGVPELGVIESSRR